MNADEEWTPERIRSLREELQMSQTAFGLEIWDTTPGTAQKNISRLENGHRPASTAVQRTLQRLEKVAKGERPFEDVLRGLPFDTMTGHDIEGVENEKE